MSRLSLAVLALAVAAAAAWSLGARLVERAKQAVEEQLSASAGVPVSVARITLALPRGAVLHGVEAGPVQVRRVHLDVSLPGLIQRNPYQAVTGASADGVRLSLGTGDPSAAIAAALDADFTLEPEGEGLRVRVGRGSFRVEESAWDLEGSLLLGPEGPSALEVRLVPQNGRGDVTLAAAPLGAGKWTVEIRGEGVDFPALWTLLAPFLPHEAAWGLPSPGRGRAWFHVQLAVGPRGVEEGQGEARIEQLAWDAFVSDRVQGQAVYAARGPGEGRVQGRVELGGAWLGATRLAGGVVEFASGPRGLELSGSLEAGGGRISAARLVPGPAELSGEITLDGVALPALEQALRDVGLALPAGRWRGRLSGRLALSGTPSEPAVRFALQGERAGAAGIAVDRAEAAGEWRDGLWRVERIDAGGPGDFRLAASGSWAPGQKVDLEADWQALSLATLGTFLDNPLLQAVTGTVDGRLRLEDAGGGLSVSGQIGGRLEGQGPPVHLEAALDGRAGGPFQIGGTLAAGEGTARVRSLWGAGEVSLEASLERFPLAAATGLWGWPGVQGEASGRVQLARAAGGAWTGAGSLEVPRLKAGGVELAGVQAVLDLPGPAPGEASSGQPCRTCLFGEGRLEGRIVPSRPGERASDVHLAAAFRGDRVELVPSSIALWGGRVTLWGGARAAEDGRWRLDLRSEGKGLRFARFGSTADFDFHAALAGPVDGLKLTAAARVAQGEVDLFQLPARAGGAGTRGAVPGSGVALDLSLQAASLRLRARSLLDAEVAGSMRVTGAGGQLQASGDFEVVRGSFGYLGRRFEIERGSGSFQGTSLVPVLNVTGRTRQGGVTLYVDAVGPADDLALSFRVDPPLDGERLRELVMEPLGGSSSLSGDWGALARVLAAIVNRQVVSEVYWSLGRALEEALGVDMVEIAQGDGDALLLRLGKYVTPELYVAYRRDLSQGREQTVSLEYSLGRHSQLRTSWDQERGTFLELGVSLPF